MPITRGPLHLTHNDGKMSVGHVPVDQMSYGHVAFAKICGNGFQYGKVRVLKLTSNFDAQELRSSE